MRKRRIQKWKGEIEREKTEKRGGETGRGTNRKQDNEGRKRERDMVA